MAFFFHVSCSSESSVLPPVVVSSGPVDHPSLWSRGEVPESLQCPAGPALRGLVPVADHLSLVRCPSPRHLLHLCYRHHLWPPAAQRLTDELIPHHLNTIIDSDRIPSRVF
ncbi:uncharacterized protein LOC119483964 isoform X3 [Sebastes umbrosus]|uniref:uncharacterized protein LOC119483964 isoform X3 n=1 Tax=Sebastes umbrosus TaxID=72105 RepID=UPI00189E4165|nr:uncharacterized protein LOC119483964 isoform X3 [Sebastes umbrosus]